MAGLVLGWMPLAAAAEDDPSATPIASAEALPSTPSKAERPAEEAEPPAVPTPSKAEEATEPERPAAIEKTADVEAPATTEQPDEPEKGVSEVVESVMNAFAAEAAGEPAGSADPSTTPIEPTPSPTEASNQIVAGSLSWGLKASFRNYIKGPIAHGAISAGDPATDNGNVTVFPAGGGQWGGEVATLGSVRYYGHGGDLDLTLLNPRLRTSASPAVLVVDARDSDDVWYHDLELASVELSGAVSIDGDTVTVTRALTRLTSAGAQVFAYLGTPMYPGGTELDPLSAVFTVENSGSVPSPSTPATTIPAVPTPTATTASPSASPTPTPSPTPTSSATTKPAKTRGGSLTWGVKQSFRSYVTGPIAKGAITVSAGAGASGGNFRFGQASTTADLPDADGTTRYRGRVRFTGHQGELDLAFSDPTIRISGSSAVLSVSATGQGRIDLATLDLSSGRRSASGGAVTYSGVPASLTNAGVAVFSYNGNAFYAAGTSLDPVSFTIGARSSVASGTKLVAAAVTPSATPTPSVSVPPASSESPTPTPAQLIGCPATQATLSWGFKESFRAYVSGSIANGDWTTSGNATYQTPLFSWHSGTGVRAEEGAGEIGFTGAIEFTGHSGALDTTIADPVLRFTGPDAATLLVDYAGTSMDDALAGKENRQQVDGVPFVDLELSRAAITADGDLVTLSDIPSTLTEAGSAAFPNYPAGTAFDPVTLSYRTGTDCTATADASVPPTAPDAPETPVPSPGASPTPLPAAGAGTSGWVPWLGGGVIGAIVASAATVWVMRRRGGIG